MANKLDGLISLYKGFIERYLSEEFSWESFDKLLQDTDSFFMNEEHQISGGFSRCLRFNIKYIINKIFRGKLFGRVAELKALRVRFKEVQGDLLKRESLNLFTHITRELQMESSRLSSSLAENKFEEHLIRELACYRKDERAKEVLKDLRVRSKVLGKQCVIVDARYKKACKFLKLLMKKRIDFKDSKCIIGKLKNI